MSNGELILVEVKMIKAPQRKDSYAAPFPLDYQALSAASKPLRRKFLSRCAS